MELEHLNYDEIERRVLIVIKALFRGHSIKFRDYIFRLDADFNLCAVIHSSSTGEVLVKVNFGDYNLRNYVAWVHELSDSDIDLIVANLALNEVGR